jgi:sugar phosphate isomerase/epimerase
MDGPYAAYSQRVAKIALQLYTVREECDRDLEETLRRIAELGYDGVELFELHGHTTNRVRGWLDEAGLAVVGRHARLETFEQELDGLSEELATLGTDRAAQSWAEPEAIREPGPLLERMQAAAASAHDAGLRFGFHNHWTEIEPLDGGGSFLDRLRELPDELIWLELDLGWIWHAGGDPLAELEASAGRCPVVHVKDYASRDSRDDVPVGDGIVGYDRVIPAALDAGVEWLVVEEDEVGSRPFEAVDRSLHAVRRYAERA